MRKLILLAKVRCDKCIKDHKKCNKELEGCKRCIRIKANCRYSVIKQCRDESIKTVEDNIRTFSIEDVSMVKKDDRKLKVMGLCKDINKMMNINIPFDIKTVIKIFKLRSTYNVILKIFGGNIFDKPYDFNMTHYLFSRFYMLLSSQSYIKPTIVYDKDHIPLKEEYNEILDEALMAYFKHINLEMPLFLCSTFNPAKRGKVLMAAIYACGIPFIKKSNVSKIIHKNCIDTLIGYLSKPIFYPKLETLQIILLINKGLKHVREITKYSWRHFEAISSLAYQLALHLKPSGIQDQEILLERKLCLCAIITISHIRIIMFDAPAPFHASFYTNQIDLTTPTWKLSKDSLDIGSMILSECNYYYSLAYIRFYELKDSFENNFEKLEKYIQISIINLRGKIKKAYYKYLKFKSQNLFVDKDVSFMDLIRFYYYLYLMLLARYLLLRAKKSTDSPFYPNRISRYKAILQRLTLNQLEYVHALEDQRRTFLHYGITFYSLCYGLLHLDNHPSKSRLINLGVDILNNKEKSPVCHDNPFNLLDFFFFVKSLNIII